MSRSCSQLGFGLVIVAVRVLVVVLVRVLVIMAVRVLIVVAVRVLIVMLVLVVVLVRVLIVVAVRVLVVVAVRVLVVMPARAARGQKMLSGGDWSEAVGSPVRVRVLERVAAVALVVHTDTNGGPDEQHT
jgi:hypothetical protein